MFDTKKRSLSVPDEIKTAWMVCYLVKQGVRSGVQLSCTDTLFWKFFLSWHAAKSFIKYLTMESFIPTSMLSINKMDYVARRNIECFLKFQMFALIQILGVNFPRHLVRFSHAFPLDSFSRTARTRSHVQCWQLSSLGINLEFRYLQVMLIDNIRFIIPTP